MTWETRDVLVLVIAGGGVAAAWGVAKSQVAVLATALARLETTLEKEKSSLAAEVRELKRDLQLSQRDQGRRLGELETAAKISKEIGRMVERNAGKTPAFGTLVAALQAAQSAPGSGQVQQPVADGSSSEDDERR